MSLRTYFRLFTHTQLLPILESGEETLVGGQAVMEGVMMRAPHSYCVAVRKPRTVGVKVTEIVQLLPAVRVVEQLVLRVKSARFEMMLLTLMDVLWPFLSVTFFTELDVPGT